MTGRGRRHASLLATCVALIASASQAAAEIPVPRIAPRAELALARLAVARPALSHGERAGPPVPLALAIEAELTVDVSRAVAQAYAARGHRPIWDAASESALRARLAKAAHDGLDPADYRLPRTGRTVAARAWHDVLLTETALRYARHLHSGRLVPTAISRIITLEPPQLAERVFLKRLGRGELARALHLAAPRHPQYHALRARLVDALERPSMAATRVGAGPNLKRGVRDPRVARLRSRLGVTVMRGRDPTHYDEMVHEAVLVFQGANRLTADGIVGPRTLAALDGEPEVSVAELVSNMERWRWMPRRLGAFHVMVNVPSYRVKVIDGDHTAYDGKVIVGTPSNPTPIFSDAMEHVVVNPYWNVPYSIASKEMLPAIAANPRGYFRRRGYEAVYRGRVVDPASLRWNASTLRNIRVRQRPGRGNALGSVKFMFPNRHAVYLHDTPTKHLFARQRRAYSHGCVRVDQPFVFANALLAGEAELSGDRLRRMVGGGQRHLPLARTIPVHLAYFTLEVGQDGHLVRHADVYGYDARTQKALRM